MIALSIKEKQLQHAKMQIEQANKNDPVDMIEIRIDSLQNPYEYTDLLKKTHKPIILTCRPEREGGEWKESEEERILILKNMLEQPVQYVDIESDTFSKLSATLLPKYSYTKIICSFHDFQSVPNNLEDKVQYINQLPCDIVKFAVLPAKISDNLRVLDCIKKITKPCIAIAMGEIGEMSRILALAYGAFMTFAAIEKGKESAPGQLPASELAELYRIKSVNKGTEIYGVCGNPIAHSLSPLLHNSAFKKYNINAVYLKWKVDELNCFLQQTAIPLNVKGLSITIPHKEAAFTLAQSSSEFAKQTLVANTLTRTSETTFSADNFDAVAAYEVCMEALKSRAKSYRVLLIGAGGTAQSLAYIFTTNNHSVEIYNRTYSRAKRLANDCGAIAVDKIITERYDLIINATSVGMYPNINESPLEGYHFHKHQVVFDVVYNPRDTKLLTQAIHDGAIGVSGIEMLIRQAALQFQRWTGIFPLDVMKQAVYG